MREFIDFLFKQEKSETGSDRFIDGAIFVGIGAALALLALYAIIAPWSIAAMVFGVLVFYWIGKIVLLLMSCLFKRNK